LTNFKNTFNKEDFKNVFCPFQKSAPKKSFSKTADSQSLKIFVFGGKRLLGLLLPSKMYLYEIKNTAQNISRPSEILCIHWVSKSLNPKKD
jgi:hypothetical protein